MQEAGHKGSSRDLKPGPYEDDLIAGGDVIHYATKLASTDSVSPKLPGFRYFV